jgi:hypothetical protein
MIEVILKPNKRQGSKRWTILDRNDPLDRPFFMSPYGKYIHIAEDVHQWLIDNNIEYRMYRKGNNSKELIYYVIIFEKVEYAVLFKLTWF